jgi:hypothetical protein
LYALETVERDTPSASAIVCSVARRGTSGIVWRP